MRNRIRNILILITASTAGIFALQGYWLYQAYQIRLEEFNRDINDALRTAVFYKQFNDAGKLLGYSHTMRVPGILPAHVLSGQAGTTVFAKTSPTLPGIRQKGRNAFFMRKSTTTLNDSTGEHYEEITENGKTFRVDLSQDTIYRVAADSLSRRISNILVLNRFFDSTLTLNRLDSMYTEELVARGIHTGFRLDTLRMEKEDSFFAFAENKLQTAPIPFNPVQNLLVSATFKSPLTLILGKMIWSLLASALLMLLMVLCFVYMLRTILRQKRLSEVRNDFINNMTHELKTPIATVSAAVEALQHFNALQDQQRTSQYLNISRNELHRLNDLVEKVLHIAAEEKEDFELTPELTDLNELISGIITNHRLKSAKKVDFTYTVLADAQVKVDSTHLSNAINNLVDNAIKYSPEPASITIMVTRQQNRLKISVKDNGIGIPHAYQENIFEKFFRVPTGNLHNVKGFGLGLSYVKKIVEKHGGWVRVKSEPDKGSEFLLEIPLT
ncbi:sensor histidine kinase [Chitinophaga barathri]|uniref:histidine kinase n=1 Tax=Chitinophaga barathri TaxID=1647451 RepID=A0A3N4M5R9_9BACT|nr:HAMP domain-containing sensor histidine kinase [Chitinophaga barathri]RPD38428.1 sensor histidine kinase [Chitinophaga barathri]